MALQSFGVVWCASYDESSANDTVWANAVDKLRLDKWLWAARFYKTRSLAAHEVGKGKVSVNDQLAKPAREVVVGDLVAIRKDGALVTVNVCGLSGVRGPATVARQLYTETPESCAAREHAGEIRRLAPEPAREIASGRPTKRDRRQIDLLRGK